MRNSRKIVCLSLLILIGNHLRAQNCFEKCMEIVEHSNLPMFERGRYVISQLVGCRAPDFKVQSIKGETFELSKLGGKVVVLNFWFTSCAPCVAELPGLNDLVDEFKNGDVVFIAFERKNSEPAGDFGPLNEFLARHKFKYHIIQSDTEFAMKYCTVSGWPMNMVLDKEGIVRQVFSGGRVDEQAPAYVYDKLKPTIDKYLKEP